MGATLRIAAAASLSDVLPPLLDEFARLNDCSYQVSFGGSGELAAQVRHGATYDLLFLASWELVKELEHKQLVVPPCVVGPSNQLVLVTSTKENNAHADFRFADLDSSKLAIGSIGVPAGDYARRWIVSSIPELTAQLVEFPHVRSVLAAVEQQSCAAGFVYLTDLDGRSELQILARANLDLVKAYGIAVLHGSAHQQTARTLAEWLAQQHHAWLRAGFQEPPKR